MQDGVDYSNFFYVKVSCRFCAFVLCISPRPSIIDLPSIDISAIFFSD